MGGEEGTAGGRGGARGLCIGSMSSGGYVQGGVGRRGVQVGLDVAQELVELRGPSAVQAVVRGGRDAEEVRVRGGDGVKHVADEGRPRVVARLDIV
jgi:hypothetical protein